MESFRSQEQAMGTRPPIAVSQALHLWAELPVPVRLRESGPDLSPSVKVRHYTYLNRVHVLVWLPSASSSSNLLLLLRGKSYHLVPR